MNGNVLKCLIEFNDKKYKIEINYQNCLNFITFNDVYNQIKINPMLKEISTATHSFQIFDEDFKEYIEIYGTEPVKHLSRIRVSSTNQMSAISHENSVERPESLVSIDSMQSNVEQSNCRDFYLNNNEVCLSLIKTINKNIDFLNQIQSKAEKYEFLSEKMRENGFIEFEPKLCENYFKTIQYYTESINSSDIRYVNPECLPLVDIIHNSYQTLGPFLTNITDDLNLVPNETKQRFNNGFNKNGFEFNSFNTISSNNSLAKNLNSLNTNDSLQSNNTEINCKRMNCWSKESENETVDTNEFKTINFEVQESPDLIELNNTEYICANNLSDLRPTQLSPNAMPFILNPIRGPEVGISLPNIYPYEQNTQLVPHNILENSFQTHPNYYYFGSKYYPLNLHNFNDCNSGLNPTPNNCETKRDEILIDIIQKYYPSFMITDHAIVFERIAEEMSNNGVKGLHNYDYLRRFKSLIDRYFAHINEPNIQKVLIEFPLFLKMKSIDSTCPTFYSLIAKTFSTVESQKIGENRKNLPQTKSVNKISNKKLNGINSFFNKNEVLLKTIVFDDDEEILNKINGVNDFDQQIEIFRNKFLLKESDIKNRKKLSHKLEEILSKNGFECKLHIFGSTISQLGFRDSDIDIYVEIAEISNHKITAEEAGVQLKKIQGILTKTLGFKIFEPLVKPEMRCPFLRIDFNKISPKVKHNGIKCDINCSNPLGPKNSSLIQFLCEIEPRFQTLALILKYWAKYNKVISSQGMCSYAFTQLVIFFCQNTVPPLLPTVEHLRELAKKSVVINGWDCGFCDNKDLIEKSNNQQKVAELLQQFFKFYDNFNFSSKIVRTKTGSALEKTDHKNGFVSTPFICIEDPFDSSYNLTERIQDKMFSQFVRDIKQIAINADSVIIPEKINDLNKNWGISGLMTSLSSDLKQDYVINRESISLRGNCFEIIEKLSKVITKQLMNVLNFIYEIETNLIKTNDISDNKLSEFMDFDMNFTKINSKTIKSSKRSEVSDNCVKTNDYWTHEKEITEKLKSSLNESKSEVIMICKIKLYVKSCIYSPYIVIEVIDVKPLEMKAKTKRISELIKSIIKTIIDENEFMDDLSPLES